MPSLYEILGAERTATAAQIKTAYRKASSKHHPDKGGDTEKFKRVKEAYEVLSDPDKRKRYDDTGQFSNAVDNEDAEMRRDLVLLATQVLDACPDGTDILREVRQHISRQISEARRGIKQNDRSIEKRRKAAKGFSSASQDSLFQDAFLDQIARYEEHSEEITTGIKKMEKLLVMLKDFSFESDYIHPGYQPTTTSLTY